MSVGEWDGQFHKKSSDCPESGSQTGDRMEAHNQTEIPDNGMWLAGYEVMDKIPFPTSDVEDSVVGVPFHLNKIGLDKIERGDDNRLTTTFPRLQLTRGAYRHKTVRTWNTMPDNLRAETRLARFKAGVKTWLKETKRPPEVERPSQQGDRPPDQ